MPTTTTAATEAYSAPAQPQGACGMDGVIAPNATLGFKVELVGVR